MDKTITPINFYIFLKKSEKIPNELHTIFRSYLIRDTSIKIIFYRMKKDILSQIFNELKSLNITLRVKADHLPLLCNPTTGEVITPYKEITTVEELEKLLSKPDELYICTADDLTNPNPKISIY